MEGRILKLPLGMRTSSRKGHGGLPREREIFWGWGKEKGRKGMCGKKKINSYVWKGVVHERYVCKN